MVFPAYIFITDIDRNPKQPSSTGITVPLDHVLHPAIGGQSQRPHQSNICSFISEVHCPYPGAGKLIRIAPLTIKTLF